MVEDPEEAASERRERLRALRAAVELVGTKDTNGHAQLQDHQDTPQEESDQDVKFRNYTPRDKHLQPNKVSPPIVPKFDDPLASTPVATGAEDPFVSIAPKKANWDLRRGVAKKLEKLEKRTQRALIELMQEEERRRQELAGDEQSLEEEAD